MLKEEMIERSKMYLRMLCEGVHPVTGREIPADSAFVDERVRNCFAFITQVLDEYIELSEKAKRLEAEKEKQTVIIPKKMEFSVSKEQCDSIKLSKEPLSIISFMKNINSVIDSQSMEKLTSTRINKWLSNQGLIESSKVQTIVNKTVYKPSNTALKIGIIEEEIVDKKSGELKTQLRLSESAQLFIIENLEEIVSTTK